MATATVALAAGGLFALPASAVAEDSSATALKASGLLAISPTPNAQCPPGTAPLSVATAALPTLLTVNVLNAQCSSTGPTASSSVANATLAGTLLAPAGLKLGAVNSSCRGATGTSSVLAINGTTLLASPFTVETPLGLATVKLNEQTNSGGYLTQNAVHITIPVANEDIIIAQSRCKSGPTPVIPESRLVILLPLSAVGLFGGAYLMLRRRRGAVAQA